MESKVAELSGAQLDYWVGRALGLPPHSGKPLTRRYKTYDELPFDTRPHHDPDFGDDFEPSERWDHGGPIIEREQITIKAREDEAGPLEWAAFVGSNPVGAVTCLGPTPLIAAMRAYVASRFGDTVQG
jgi:hypothetical protein